MFCPLLLMINTMCNIDTNVTNFMVKIHICVTKVSNFALSWITITKTIILCIELSLWHYFKTKILSVLQIYYVNHGIIRKILFTCLVNIFTKNENKCNFSLFINISALHLYQVIHML